MSSKNSSSSNGYFISQSIISNSTNVSISLKRPEFPVYHLLGVCTWDVILPQLCDYVNDFIVKITIACDTSNATSNDNPTATKLGVLQVTSIKRLLIR